MSDTASKGLWFSLNLSILIPFLIIVLSLGALCSRISDAAREKHRGNNITGMETYSAMEDYSSYLTTGEYDGTYSLTETMSAIRENINTYNIYIIKTGSPVEVNSLSAEGQPIIEYLDDGKTSYLKEFVFDGFTDDTAQYVRYIDINTDGSINAVYYCREVI